MKLSHSLLLAAIPLLLTQADVAHSTEEHLVTPGYSKADDISLDPGEAVVGFFEANRSYECRVSQGLINSGSDDYVYFDTTISGPSGSVSATPSGATYPVEAVIDSATARQSEHRISFIPTTSGLHTFTLKFDNNFGIEGSVDCFETTLAGSFNSFFAQIPIVELRNRGNAAISAEVTAIDFDGVQLDKKTTSVPASSRADVILNVPASRFGTITVTYLSPRGSLSGIVAEYDSDANGNLTLKRERPLSFSQVVP